MSTICKKSVPELIWKIPNVKSFLHNFAPTISSQKHQFCQSIWSVRLSSWHGNICLHLKKELSKTASERVHRNFILFKANIAAEDGKQCPIFDTCLTNDDLPLTRIENGTKAYEAYFRREIPHLNLTDDHGLQIVCRIRCIDCPVQLEYIPVSPNHIKNPLKRKYNEEDLVEIDGLKVKEFFPSGSDILLRNMKDLFIKGVQTDLTIKVKNQSFNLHRFILLARPSICSKILEEFTEKNTTIIQIDDCEAQAFESFIKYLYCGELDINPKEICELYHIGQKFEVQDIKHLCSEAMMKHLTITNFCEIFSCAIQYNEEKVLKIATDFFIRYEKKIISSENWLPFLKENLKAANELHIKAAERRAN